jgi:hypothetical protein
MRPACSGACLALALAGCSPDPDAVGRPMTPGTTQDRVFVGDPCGAGRLQSLVGQNAETLNAAALPVESRIVYPGAETGPAFRSDRLTVIVDESATITRVECG